MTTIVLDRDRSYGSALARVISRRQGPDEITLIIDSDALPRLLARDPYALVIVDEEAVQPPGALHRLISRHPDARFVVVASSLRPTAVTYLEDGAVGIVHRPGAMRTLEPAVAAVSNGLCAIPPQLVRLLLRHFHLGVQAEEHEERLAKLSPREHEILELLLSGRDAARVADALDLSIHTVRSHLKRILRKLEVHSTLEAVLIAVGAGIVPVDVVGSEIEDLDVTGAHRGPNHPDG